MTYRGTTTNLGCCPVISRYRSNAAGGMRRSPSSHCCHDRRVPWIVPAATVWVCPTASRAARTASGVGFEAPEGLPRLGWDAMSARPELDAAAIFRDLPQITIRSLDRRAELPDMNKRITLALIRREQFDRSSVDCGFLNLLNAVVGSSLSRHDFPIAPVPEARRIRRIHDLNNTHIVRKVQGVFSEGKPA